MGFTLGDIAKTIGGRLSGDPQIVIDHVCPVEAATAGGICVVWDHRAFTDLGASRAAALVIPEGIEAPGKNLIEVADPRATLVDLLELLNPRSKPTPGIEAGAVVSGHARCAEDVFVACGARVEAGAELRSGVEIHANAFVGEQVFIDEGTVIHPNATLYRGTRIGKHAIIHSGAVIGADGFGYLSENGRQRKIPHVGVVVIEDDVEIGAGTTIDRATIGRTVVGRGTKIDNQVQIAHNCDIGSDCCIVAQVGVAGTAKVGDRAMIGGQAGILDHVKVGSEVVVAARAGVVEDAPSGVWLGSPAMPAAHTRRVLALVARLPEIYDEIRSLRTRCRALEEELAHLRSERDR